MIAIQTPAPSSDLLLSKHAEKRMQTRRISAEDIEYTLAYGRTFFTRGALFTVIGREEIDRYRYQVDLEHLDGMHVICSREGVIITVYRNRQFRAKSYPNETLRRHRHRRLSRR